MKRIKRVHKWLGIGGAVAIIGGVGGWLHFRKEPPKITPNQLLCPIAPASVEDPDCDLYTGQSYEKHLHHLVDAVKLDKNEVGLYKNFAGDLVVFQDIGFNPYPAPYSVVYPRDVLLYKTERATDDPTKCPDHLTQYGLCDTPVDRIVFGNGVEGEVDLAISFKIEATSDNLEELYDIGGPDRFIDLFKQVVRSNRQLTSVEAQVANTEAGAEQIEETFRQALADWSLSHLFNIENVSIRGVLVGSDDYRQQQEAQVAEVAQQDLEADSLAFKRDQQLAEAENFAQSIERICANIPPDRCPEMVWVLINGGQMQPFLAQDGELTSLTPDAQPQRSQTASTSP